MRAAQLLCGTPILKPTQLNVPSLCSKIRLQSLHGALLCVFSAYYLELFPYRNSTCRNLGHCESVIPVNRQVGRVLIVLGDEFDRIGVVQVHVREKLRRSDSPWSRGVGVPFSLPLRSALSMRAVLLGF